MNVPLLWLLRRFKLKIGTSLAKFKTAIRTLQFRRAHSGLTEGCSQSAHMIFPLVFSSFTTIGLSPGLHALWRNT